MPMLIPVAIAAAAAYTVGATIVLTVAMTAMSAYQQYKAKKKARDDYNKSLSDRLVMVATTNAARSIVLGRVRTGDGVVFKGAWGDKSESLTLVVALAGHEIDAVEQVYFGDIPVTLDGSGLVMTPPYGVTRKETTSHVAASTGGPQTVTLPNVPLSVIAVTYRVGRGSEELSYSWTPGSANVSFNSAGVTGDIYISYAGTVQYSAARVSTYLGSSGQDLSGVLSVRFPSLITSAHRFRGIACLVVDMIYTQDAYPSGVPAITARVRGAKVYDPRTGLTGWSANPALCARHIALHPWAGGSLADEIDDASVIAAANACDVSRTYTDSSGVSTTRPAYTCAYVASTEASPDTHVGELVEAMGGKWGWAGGRIRMRAGVYTAPVATITDDWLGPGQRQIVPGPGQADLVNMITPTIADAAQHHVATPIAPMRAQAYIDADGMELPTETTLSAVDFAPQAQHICAITLREMRQGMTLNWPVNMRGFVLELFDNILLTSPRYGFDAKPFEVVGWSFNLEGGIQLVLRETGASIYQPDNVFPANDPEPNTSLPLPWEVPTIEGLAAFSGAAELLKQSDGTVVSRVRLTFDAIEDEAVLAGGQIEVQYRPADGDWATQFFDGAMTTVYLQGLQDRQWYLIRARARNALCAGDWSESVGHTVVGKSEPPANVTGLAATAVEGAIEITFDPNATDLDYAYTHIKVGPAWISSSSVAKTRGAARWDWPADGSYLIRARHIDTTGNESSLEAVVAVTVAGADIALDYVNLLPGSAADAPFSAVEYEIWPIPTSGPPIKNVAAASYENETDDELTIEIFGTTQHILTQGSGSGVLGAFSYFGIGIDGPASYGTNSGPVASGAVVGSPVEWEHSMGNTVLLAAGSTITVTYNTAISGVVGAGSTLEILNAMVRLTAIKR